MLIGSNIYLANVLNYVWMYRLIILSLYPYLIIIIIIIILAMMTYNQVQSLRINHLAEYSLLFIIIDSLPENIRSCMIKHYIPRLLFNHGQNKHKIMDLHSHMQNTN